MLRLASGLHVGNFLRRYLRNDTGCPRKLTPVHSTARGHPVPFHALLAPIGVPRNVLLPCRPQDPEFTGRKVVTFHCQRDYVFVRQHRYIFPEEKKGTAARLQEIGPRFTLKLRSMQSGTFDSSRAEYEWIHRKENDTSKRKFFL